jgi:hypothetical protein
MSCVDEPIVPAKIELDEHADLIARYRKCRDLEAQWKKEKEIVKAQLAKLMGDAEVGLLNGEKVLTYAREERFNTTEFRKQYPDMYKLYMKEKTVEQFDLEGFRLTRSELFEEFQVRSLRVEDA